MMIVLAELYAISLQVHQAREETRVHRSWNRISNKCEYFMRRMTFIEDARALTALAVPKDPAALLQTGADSMPDIDGAASEENSLHTTTAEKVAQVDRMAEEAQDVIEAINDEYIVSSLQEENSRLAEMVELATRDNERTKQELTKVQSELKESQTKLDTQATQMEAHSKLIAELEGDVTAFRVSTDEKNTALSEAKERCDQLESERCSLVHNNATQVQELELKLKSTTEALAQQTAAADTHCTDVTADQTEIQEQLRMALFQLKLAERNQVKAVGAAEDMMARSIKQLSTTQANLDAAQEESRATQKELEEIKLAHAALTADRQAINHGMELIHMDEWTTMKRKFVLLCRLVKDVTQDGCPTKLKDMMARWHDAFSGEFKAASLMAAVDGLNQRPEDLRSRQHNVSKEAEHNKSVSTQQVEALQLIQQFIHYHGTKNAENMMCEGSAGTPWPVILDMAFGAPRYVLDSMVQNAARIGVSKSDQKTVSGGMNEISTGSDRGQAIRDRVSRYGNMVGLVHEISGDLLITNETGKDPSADQLTPSAIKSAHKAMGRLLHEISEDQEHAGQDREHDEESAVIIRSLSLALFQARSSSHPQEFNHSNESKQLGEMKLQLEEALAHSGGVQESRSKEKTAYSIEIKKRDDAIAQLNKELEEAKACTGTAHSPGALAPSDLDTSMTQLSQYSDRLLEESVSRARVECERDALNAQLVSVTEEIAVSRDKMAQQKSEFDIRTKQTESELARSSAKCEALLEELRQQEHDWNVSSQENIAKLQGLQSDKDLLSRDLTSSSSDVAALTNRLTDAQQHLEQQKQAWDQSDSEKEELTVKMEELQRGNEQLRRNLEASGDSVTMLTHRLAELQQQELINKQTQDGMAASVKAGEEYIEVANRDLS